jgi:hypothetical protein
MTPANEPKLDGCLERIDDDYGLMECAGPKGHGGGSHSPNARDFVNVCAYRLMESDLRARIAALEGERDALIDLIGDSRGNSLYLTDLSREQAASYEKRKAPAHD